MRVVADEELQGSKTKTQSASREHPQCGSTLIRLPEGAAVQSGTLNSRTCELCFF